MSGLLHSAARAAFFALAAASFPPAVASGGGESSPPAAASGGAGGDRAGASLADLHTGAAAALKSARREAPKPRDVSWERARLGELALAGTLLDLRAADLTGDGSAEILALAPGEAIAVSPAGEGGGAASPEGTAAGLDVVGRADFEALAPASIRPRWPLGTSAIERRGGQRMWRVRSSARGQAAAITWADGGLALRPDGDAYPLCGGVEAALATGRSELKAGDGGWWGESEEAVHGARCRRDLVDSDGYPLSVYASAHADGELEVRVKPRCEEGECDQVRASAEDRGYAIAIADLRGDGHPELASPARRPPGEAGAVEVFTLEGEDLVSLHREEFAGPVRGLAAGDLRGRGRLDLVVAVAAEGGRIELWTLTS